MSPEDIERLLIDDAAGVTASPAFTAAVIAAVRREAEVPPPLSFPWTRAWPGIAAVLLVFLGSWLAAPSVDAGFGADAVLAVAGWVESASASVDPVWFAIAIAVAALTVVPVAAPFWLVSAARDS